MGTFLIKHSRICIGFLLIGMCYATSGCSLNPFSRKINLAGVYTHEPSSYTPVETGTFRVNSDELVNRRDHGGGKTTLFWGLFTYTDY
ncbi:MAG TPA: hypothetical protein DCL00_07655 [Opitutae bacterium]|nr:hypothetical protein [Opitutae bacterium]HAF59448.1 hypothetical protein [Opitutae bacterium]